MTSNIVANLQYAIEEGEKESELYVRSFLDYLNGVIKSSENEWFEYENLVKVWNAYLVLEKMRLEERFDYELIYDTKLNQSLLPSLVGVSFLRHYVKTVVRKSSSHIKLKIEVIKVGEETAQMRIDIVGNDSAMSKNDEERSIEDDCLRWISQKINLLQYQNKTELSDLEIMSEAPNNNISFNSVTMPIK